MRRVGVGITAAVAVLSAIPTVGGYSSPVVGIVTQVEGRPYVFRNGGLRALEVSVGTGIYALDEVWVPRGGVVRVTDRFGGKVTIQAGFLQFLAENRIAIVQGEVKLRPGKDKQISFNNALLAGSIEGHAGSEAVLSVGSHSSRILVLAGGALVWNPNLPEMKQFITPGSAAELARGSESLHLVVARSALDKTEPHLAKPSSSAELHRGIASELGTRDRGLLVQSTNAEHLDRVAERLRGEDETNEIDLQQENGEPRDPNRAPAAANTMHPAIEVVHVRKKLNADQAAVVAKLSRKKARREVRGSSTKEGAVCGAKSEVGSSHCVSH